MDNSQSPDLRHELSQISPVRGCFNFEAYFSFNKIKKKCFYTRLKSNFIKNYKKNGPVRDNSYFWKLSPECIYFFSP